MYLFIFRKNIQKLSYSILNKTINICKNLHINSGKNVNLVQSFSSSDDKIDIYKSYLSVKKFVNDVYKKHRIKIFPQWLPPIAWYFGGSVNMTLFSNPNDLVYIKKINLEICMDLSHFVMSCNYRNIHLSDFFEKYNKLFKHYHIADAAGLDSEGLELGNGDLYKKHLKVLKKVINNNKVKVLETWQGHLGDAAIFKSEIHKIYKINEN